MVFAVTTEQSAEAWQVFLNFGVVGIIAFVTLSFVALVIWTFWILAKRVVVKYFPELFDETVKTIRSVRESQEGIVTNQKIAVDTLSKIVDLHQTSKDRQEDLATIIKSKMDPLGAGYKDHVFSSTRVEAFLSMGLDILEQWLDKDDNAALKLDWKHHINGMRESLERKGSRA